MNLGIGDIVPEALHRKVGWDIRHHFMAEKIVDRFGLVLPRDRELVRQLAVVYVLGGMTAPPLREPEHAGFLTTRATNPHSRIGVRLVAAPATRSGAPSGREHDDAGSLPDRP